MAYVRAVIFVETPTFTKQATGGLFDDEELFDLQKQILRNPESGDLIRGSGGLRKIRLAGKGKGKSGGFRVIYYLPASEITFLLLAYPKSEKDNLTAKQLSLLRKLIE